MKRLVDLQQWDRRAHFELFRTYDHPWFNVTVPVDVTHVVNWCRDAGHSFFAACLYCSTRAANQVPELRYRIESDEVVEYDVTHPGSTVLRPDDTFGFAYFEYRDPFSAFAALVVQEIERAKSSSGLDPRTDRHDVIHHSVLPWIAFSSFQHARRRDPGDSVPKIVFGKHFESGPKRLLPVSVEVHHALVDGIHVGRFYEALQSEMGFLPETAS